MHDSDYDSVYVYVHVQVQVQVHVHVHVHVRGPLLRVVGGAGLADHRDADLAGVGELGLDLAGDVLATGGAPARR